MKVMTEPQRRVVQRLLSKGWIEPLHYRCCVYLFLPHVRGGRQECVSRNWYRKPICVTPTGNVHSGHACDPDAEPPEGRQPNAVASPARTQKPPRRKQKSRAS